VQAGKNNAAQVNRRSIVISLRFNEIRLRINSPRALFATQLKLSLSSKSAKTILQQLGSVQVLRSGLQIFQSHRDVTRFTDRTYAFISYC